MHYLIKAKELIHLHHSPVQTTNYVSSRNVLVRVQEIRRYMIVISIITCSAENKVYAFRKTRIKNGGMV